MLELQNMLAAGPNLVKFDVGPLDVRARQLVGLQPLNLFAPARHLARPRACRKPRDELIQLRDLLFALRNLRLQRGADLRLRHHHLVVAAGVRDDGLVIDVGGVRGHRVQKVPVVRDGDQRAVVAGQEILQPVDGVEIEVVGRLVEQQRLRLAE